MEFIDLKTQYQKYKTEIDAAIGEVLESTRFIMGQPVFDLEEKLADFVGVKHCVSCSSGTDALLMALMALDVGPGDEVVTTPYTFISTLEVIKLLGAKAALVDIDPKTFNIDVEQIQGAITPRTKAILPVSLFGLMPDYDRINEIASKHGIPVVEDAAQSFGAEWKDKRSCGVTTIGTTSFFPAKPLGCYGDGGALFTDDDVLASRMRAIRCHGGEKRHTYTTVGINGRLDSIQAAILLAKLPYFEEELEARYRIGARYSALLRDVAEVPQVDDLKSHIYAIYTIRLRERDAVQAWLKEKGIPAPVYYPVSCHLQPAFADWGYGAGDFPESERAGGEVLSLPMHPFLDEKTQDRIVEAVKDVALVAASA